MDKTPGEWTPETVSDIVGRDFDGMAAIALAHNAALAERNQPKPATGEIHTRARETFQDIAPASGEQRCPGPRQHGHPLIYESHCDHGETKAHIIKPKPASGDKGRQFAEDEADYIESKLPNPTTGEWTLQSISETLINGGYQGLLDAHNAALADEGEKRADWNVVIEDLERALDAHRVENRLSQITIQQLRQQLAAERENRIREDREWERSKQLDLAEIQQLREQLAAAVELLKSVRTNSPVLRHKIDAALAKIGGKHE